MRPAIDLLGGLDAASGSVISSVAVFCMTTVSVGKRMHQKAPLNSKISIPLACGALAGGSIGHFLLSHVVARVSNNHVTIMQNAVLAFVIACTFLYMLNRSKIASLDLAGIVPAVMAGIFLGTQAAFLGIGGGPINVAVIIFLFGLSLKAAATCSLITIMAAQASNIISIHLGNGFGAYDLSMLAPLAIGAVVGGFLGASVSKRLSDNRTDLMFNGVLIVVFAISVINVVRAV